MGEEPSSMQGVAPPTGGSLTGVAKEEEVEDPLRVALNAHPMVFN